MAAQTEFILGQGYGYGYSLGLGAAFAIMMIAITYLLAKYVGEKQDSEHFSTGSRSIKTGLISSAVVSSWMWAATLILSSSWSYLYGVAGLYWYSIIGSVQIVLFSLLALEIKLIAPGAHTVAEIVKARFGVAGHAVYLIFCLVVNIIVSAMLLLGGAQGFNAATGMNVIAACFLLPLGVLFYTVFGGIKATFLSDWIHTVIIYVIVISTLFAVYTTSSLIGSPGNMYDLLKQAAITSPSPTGEGGSYLTMRNRTMLMTAWSTLLGGFVSVFGDPSFVQKAIAASPKAAFKGYMLGGIAWFSIPWGLGSSAGLAARALANNPAFFAYPGVLSTRDVNVGLPLFYGMAAIFGKSGAAAGLLMLFMSVTSSTSSELVAFSSIITYDIYRAYINPKASGKALVTVSHLSVAAFALIMGGLAVMFNYVGVTIGWIMVFKGVILGPIVSSLTLTLFWSRMNKWGLILGAPLGTATGVGVWVGTGYHFNHGSLNVNTIIGTNATLTANFVSLFSTPIYIAIISLALRTEKFDFSVLGNWFQAGDDANENEIEAMVVHRSSQIYRELKQCSIIGRVLAAVFVGVFLFLIPMPIYGSKYETSKGVFTFWIVIIFIWLMTMAMYITFWPIYESRHEIMLVFRMSTTSKSQMSEISAASSTPEEGSSVEEDDDLAKVSVVEKVKE